MTPSNEKRLSEEDKQWVLANYRTHSAEFGFSAMAKKFGVCRTTIKVVVRGSKPKRERQPKINPSSTVFDRDPIIHFGKHKGLKFSEIPLDYLRWMNREIKSPTRIVEQVKSELSKRSGTAIKRPTTSKSWHDPSTHYEWTDRRGKVHSIPNDVSMVNTENEVCPF